MTTATKIQALLPDATPDASPSDSTGFRYFSAGQTGIAHDMAHRLLDQGRESDGFHWLGVWLDTHDPHGDHQGPEWVHLHWHMAVFEIAVGQIEAAQRRFERCILPAVQVGQALTDGPSLLWRLRLAGGPGLELDWGAVRDAAVRHLPEVADPYVVLHQLLALAGARDVVSIDRWLDARYECCTPSDSLLLRLAWGLRTYARGDWEPSLLLLEEALRVGELGGSRAQNELFVDLRQRAASALENHRKACSLAA